MFIVDLIYTMYILCNMYSILCYTIHSIYMYISYPSDNLYSCLALHIKHVTITFLHILYKYSVQFFRTQFYIYQFINIYVIHLITPIFVQHYILNMYLNLNLDLIDLMPNTPCLHLYSFLCFINRHACFIYKSSFFK